MACGRSVAWGRWGACIVPRVEGWPGRPPPPPRLRRRGRADCAVWGFKVNSASAEGDDAADGIVGRDANRHPVPWNHLDPEAAHPAAQLCEYLVTLVALNAIKTSAVDRHDRTLHINQIVLAQMLSSLQSKIVPHSTPICNTLQCRDPATSRNLGS